MKETELKPCPFCGGSACIIEEKIFGGTDYSFVKCKDCGARTRRFSLSLKYCPNEEAAKAWNRRATDDTP